MFRGLSFFLVTINLLSCHNNRLKSHFLSRSIGTLHQLSSSPSSSSAPSSSAPSALSSALAIKNLTNFRFYKSLNSLSPLNAYPLLVTGSINSIINDQSSSSSTYDSKQVSNTLWNLLSIARFILCKFSID